MKSLLLILILSVYSLQSDVKQYQIYEATEAGQNYLLRAQMAFTKKLIYLKIDTAIYTFHVQQFDYDKGKEMYRVGYDTLYNGEYYAIYRGLIVVMPGRIDPETHRQEGNISVECWTSRKARRVIYKYR
jgi:hypothetical protein